MFVQKPTPVAEIDYGDEVDEWKHGLNYTHDALQSCLSDLYYIQEYHKAKGGLQCLLHEINLLGWVLIICSCLFFIFCGVVAGLGMFAKWWEYRERDRKARDCYTRAIFKQ